MKEISIHGRGGQGSLVLAQFMAIAALEDGKYGQAFPFLGGGGERRGKPIMAFCRLSNRPIRLRSRVSKADYVILQDVTILGEVDVAAGLKPGREAPDEVTFFKSVGLAIQDLAAALCALDNARARGLGTELT